MQKKKIRKEFVTKRVGLGIRARSLVMFLFDCWLGIMNVGLDLTLVFQEDALYTVSHRPNRRVVPKIPILVMFGEF